MSEPCPYPDCRGERAHPSPHLIEAAAIDKRIGSLKAALREQWEWNHAEHCGEEGPHDATCHWPLPIELGGDPSAYRTYGFATRILLTGPAGAA